MLIAAATDVRHRATRWQPTGGSPKYQLNNDPQGDYHSLGESQPSQKLQGERRAEEPSHEDERENVFQLITRGCQNGNAARDSRAAGQLLQE
jgi:hypothetical protein